MNVDWIEKIRKQLSDISGEDFLVNVNLRVWHTTTRTILERALGVDSKILQQFELVSWSARGYLVDPARSDSQYMADAKNRDARATASAVERSRSILQAAIEHLELDAEMAAATRGRTSESSEQDRIRQPLTTPTVFIGHGGTSQDWLELKDFLTQKLGLEVVHFESVATAGHTAKERVMEMLDKTDIAFLVLSAEDEGVDREGQPWKRARQNVVHEAGLWQGRYGWGRALLMVENGIDRFSNSDGVGELRYDRLGIASTFYDVREVIEREFPSCTLSPS